MEGNEALCILGYPSGCLVLLSPWKDDRFPFYIIVYITVWIHLHLKNLQVVLELL